MKFASPREFFCSFSLLLALICCSPAAAKAADIGVARQLFYQGKYAECREMCAAEVERGIWNDVWSRLLIKTLLVTGEYDKAVEVYEEVAEKFKSSLPLRCLGIEAYRYTDQLKRSLELELEIPDLVAATPWRFSDRDNLLALGKIALDAGEDARLVLTTYYDRPLRSDARFVDAYVAIAKLALSKADFQEAAKNLSTAEKLRPEDPDIHHLSAKAWAASDPARAESYLEKALSINGNHIPSLVELTEQLIDAENYAAAEETIEKVLKVNSTNPEALAMRAAIAHLKGEFKREGQIRKFALANWKANPNVDFLIGRLLSKHYRFAEGEKYQRRALKLAPDNRQIKFQLAQDLLRIGREEEGWQLAEEVAAADAYSVQAYNLKTLHQNILKFTTLKAPGLVIRMDATEAEIYGPLVVDLLSSAREVLIAKYEVELDEPTHIEIFPDQSDFAIRTFGLPGGAGYLGVCFGKLITANSPASQGDMPVNWQSVLWHEYCHVVTLQKTNNRMPRWLSEGISVYEELQRDSRWGDQMTPLYKNFIEGDAFVPMSELSGAFMRPPSPLHLQFAYFESNLAVEYLIERHGFERMLRLLDDLGLGLPIDDAIEKNYGQWAALDGDFEQFVKSKTKKFLPNTKFCTPEELKQLQQLPTEELQQWIADNPDNYSATQLLLNQQLEDGQFEEAKSNAIRLAELYPDDVSNTGGLSSQIKIARQEEDYKTELRLLGELASKSNDSLASLLRKSTLEIENEMWQQLSETALEILAINPLLPQGHEALSLASAGMGNFEQAVQPLRSLLALGPVDPSKVHYDLAQAYSETAELDAARKEVLLCLEATPRYQDALSLLREIRSQLDQKDAEPKAAADANKTEKASAKPSESESPDKPTKADSDESKTETPTKPAENS